MLTAAPLKGFGEDPRKVEGLLRDDPEALLTFRRATTAPQQVHQPEGEGDIRTITPAGGTRRAYTADRLQRDADHDSVKLSRVARAVMPLIPG